VRAIPGTGLGLTITKLLTQIMGGEIAARSTLGAGTSFTVRLALSEAMHAPQNVIAPMHIKAYAGERVRILLIDDDPSHLDIVRHLLMPLKFELFTAPDGGSGLALAQECRPDLAMIDISMPDMTGWDVARELRAQQSMPHLKIIMVSANAHEYSPGGGDESLHDAFVMKPIDIQLLLERVGSLLGLKWIHETPLPSPANDQEFNTLPTESRHHLDDLYQLGRIGHVRGIQAKLQEIESEHPANKPFTTHLRTLITNFDLKRYMNVLEAMRKNG
jgi:CheY-like chemotaxis protein